MIQDMSISQQLILIQPSWTILKNETREFVSYPKIQVNAFMFTNYSSLTLSAYQG